MTEPVAENWKRDLIESSEGKPKALLANAIVALRAAQEWRGVLWYNSFNNAVYRRGRAPWTRTEGPAEEWRADHDLLTTEWLQLRGIHVSPDVAGQAVEVVARERRFHPPLEYLSRCEWDGEPRLDTWTVRYLGAPDTPYSRAVGARWMISAVARISQPGCKADCCLILEGKQGLLKSTALRTLGSPWFSDEIADLGSKDSALQLSGAWIIELAELDRLTRAEVGRVKAWMSRNSDRFRPPYGKRVEERLRQCVFAGTVNMNEYLRDETGARRFWPLACKAIDIDMLAVDRDQLWAEASHRYQAGDAWWLETHDLQAAAERQQEARYQADAWEGRIADFVRHKPYVTVAEILDHALHLSLERWGQAEQNRVGKCLRALQWERRQKRLPDGGREWRYYPRSSIEASPDDEC